MFCVSNLVRKYSTPLLSLRPLKGKPPEALSDTEDALVENEQKSILACLLPSNHIASSCQVRQCRGPAEKGVCGMASFKAALRS